MVLVNGKPFLHWQIEYYAKLGYNDFILSTGYMAEMIESYSWAKEFPGCTFRFYRESEPLGTGGAVKTIFEKFGLSRAWIINGDTLLPQPLPPAPDNFEAVYSALYKSEIFDATPNLHTEDQYVVSEGSNGRFFDGGAVFVTKKAIDRYQGAVPCSLHQVLEPAMADKQVSYAILPGTCYDIGTPDRHKRFEDYLKGQMKNAAR